MIPLKDDHPVPRSSVALPLALLALVVGGPRPLVAVLAALVVWVAGDGVAIRCGRRSAVLVALACGALAFLLADAAGDDLGWSAIGPSLAASAAAALAGAHLALAPGGRILSFTAIPGIGIGGTIAVPIAVWSLVGAALIAVGLLVDGIAGASASDSLLVAPPAAAAAGLAVGLPLRLLDRGLPAGDRAGAGRAAPRA